MKITWINFLHFYQPPTADNEAIIEATEKSYQRIVSALKRNPNIKFTFNITGCLLDKWQELGFEQLIKDIKQLVQAGQVELTGSAAFHPILPLLPKTEIERQIKLNEKILQKYFGPANSEQYEGEQTFVANSATPEATRGCNPLLPQGLHGFFIPEGTYEKKLAKQIKKLGYQWTLLDEISAFGNINGTNFTTLYQDKNSKLKICFRSRKMSKSYVPQTIFELINPAPFRQQGLGSNKNNSHLNTKLPKRCGVKKEKNKIIVTATDAELYGLRHNDVSASFEKLLKRPEITTLTVSEYLNGLRESEIIKPITSSWESTEQELESKMPYHLWYDKKNKIQVKLWQLAYLAIKTVNKYKHDANYKWARCHLDKGMSSCTFWWASAKDFRLFGPISWSPDEIERGTNELIRSIRALDDATTRRTKIQAERLYIKIKKMVWQRHWRYYWKK